jgi:uncharacterized protein YbjT (DUF2867 family)
VIVVTGANGRLGRSIIKALLLRVRSDELAASARDARQARELTDLGIRVVSADYGDPGSLVAAFGGADQVLFVSSDAAIHGGDPLVHHGNVIAAARNARVGRLVYTSHMGSGATSLFPPMHTHHATEEMLRQSGLAWTALRNGFYASRLIEIVGPEIEAGSIALPEDGKVSWTTHEDLAAGAAAILAQPGRFEGPTPPLTAGEALDLSDVARLVSQVRARRVRREVVADDVFAGRLAANGLPTAVIAISLDMYRASRNGEFATVDPTLATLIGRPTRRVESLLAE